jgi:hypothetical protein
VKKRGCDLRKRSIGKLGKIESWGNFVRKNCEWENYVKWENFEGNFVNREIFGYEFFSDVFWI